MVCVTSSVWLDSEALCPCLPIKRIVKSLIRLSVWPCCRFVRFFAGFWPRTGPYSPWLNDEHVQLSVMGFRRFWARRWSCVSDLTSAHTCGFYRPCICPILSTRLAVGCSKAHTASARAGTASEGAPYEIRKVHVQVHAIQGQNCKNTHRMGECMWHLHHRRVRTFHRLVRLPKSYGPGHTHGFHACDLSIRYFMPRSHETRTVTTLRWKSGRYVEKSYKMLIPLLRNLAVLVTWSGSSRAFVALVDPTEVNKIFVFKKLLGCNFGENS